MVECTVPSMVAARGAAVMAVPIAHFHSSAGSPTSSDSEVVKTVTYGPFHPVSGPAPPTANTVAAGHP